MTILEVSREKWALFTAEHWQWLKLRDVTVGFRHRRGDPPRALPQESLTIRFQNKQDALLFKLIYL